MNNQTHRKSVRERQRTTGLGGNNCWQIGWRRVAVARLYRTCRVLVRDRLRKYTAKWSSERGGKFRQTDSIGSDGDRSLWKESIGLAACHFTRALKTYSKVEYSERGGKRWQTDSIRFEGDRSPWKESIGRRESVHKRLIKYTAK